MIVKLDGTHQSLLVLKLEGGNLVERSGEGAARPVLEGTRLRVGTSTVEFADDQVSAVRDLVNSVRGIRSSRSTRQGEGMRGAARRIEVAGLVMVVIATVLGLVVLVAEANSGSGVGALLSALLTWALGLPLAVAVYSLGEYLGIMAEDR